MKINLLTLLLFALALVLVMSLLESNVLVLIVAAVCAAIIYYVVRTVRMIRRINSSDEDAGKR